MCLFIKQQLLYYVGARNSVPTVSLIKTPNPPIKQTPNVTTLQIRTNSLLSGLVQRLSSRPPSLKNRITGSIVVLLRDNVGLLSAPLRHHFKVLLVNKEERHGEC